MGNKELFYNEQKRHIYHDLIENLYPVLSYSHSINKTQYFDTNFNISNQLLAYPFISGQLGGYSDEEIPIYCTDLKISADLINYLLTYFRDVELFVLLFI